METETLIIILAFAGGFASIMIVVLPFLKRDQRASRLKVLSQRREELSRQQRDQLIQQRSSRRAKPRVSGMKNFMERLKLLNPAASTELKHLLGAAGYRNPSAVVTFVFSRFATAIGLALFAFLFMSLSEKFNYPFMGRVGIAIGAGGLGFFLPLILVKNAIQKRQTVMTKTFPDTLDLLVICVEAGLSVEAAFARVTEEIAEDAPILSQELGLTTAELSFLGDRRAAWANFAERTGLPAVRSLSTALIQSEKYGTPVSVALKILAQESRDERMSKAERKAGALPAQLTVPMIVFFLPVLFLVIIGPAMITVMALI